MSGLENLDSVIYGVDDMAENKRFFSDWGLTLHSESSEEICFTTQEGARIVIRHKDDPTLPPPIEDGPTVREVIWGAKTQSDLDEFLARIGDEIELHQGADALWRCTDPNGLSIAFCVTEARALDIKGSASNAYGVFNRVDAAAPVYDRAEPVRLAHVVFFVEDLEAHKRFYIDTLGFNITDEYPGRGFFSRCVKRGTHHNLFLLQIPNRPKGINHVSFGVRDIYEVAGGGIAMDSKGWSTMIGPGRHPISSAFFWYFNCPAGGQVEYYADEDYLTENWVPRKMEPSPELFAEWAITGGISGESRRQNAKQSKPVH